MDHGEELNGVTEFCFMLSNCSMKIRYREPTFTDIYKQTVFDLLAIVSGVKLLVQALFLIHTRRLLVFIYLIFYKILLIK